MAERAAAKHAAHPPVFDDQNSYTMEIDDGEMAVDAKSLTALVNRAFDYQGRRSPT